MPAALKEPAARQWADLLAIFTGVSLVAIALWPTDATATAAADRETTVTQALWLVHIATGALTLLAVFVSQRWQRRPLARALLIVTALILLGALVLFRDFTPRALLTTILPAIFLLAASFGIGPMPVDTRQGMLQQER
jgi:cytochrome bd-type quinol oxidase subunit 2